MILRLEIFFGFSHNQRALLKIIIELFLYNIMIYLLGKVAYIYVELIEEKKISREDKIRLECYKCIVLSRNQRPKGSIGYEQIEEKKIRRHYMQKLDLLTSKIL